MNNMKKQIVVIHGGNTFDTYEEYLDHLKNYELNFDRLKAEGWKETIDEKLGEGFEVISPEMPNSANAKYSEWKIIFDKLILFLEDTFVFIGHSLGGLFLAKYLSENSFSKKILATYLIAAPYDDKDSEDSLGDFVLPATLEKLEKQGGRIFVYHSEDDPIVPFIDIEKYTKALPKAEKNIFKTKGHFMQEEFPELIESIQHLY